MPTIKHVQLPQPFDDETPTTAPDTPAVEPKPGINRGNPRHAPLAWRPMPFMDDFITELYAQERKRDYIRMVRVGLSHFARYMSEVENVHDPDEITKPHLMRFQVWLQNEARTEDGAPFAVSYRRKLMCYVRAWILWMVREELVETNPWQRIRVKKTPKLPKPIHPEDLVLLFDTHKRLAFTMSPFAWHRQEVILVLLFGWGLRIHELQSLDISQMDMRLDVVSVKNKGSERPKPAVYDNEVKQCVQRYLVQRAKMAAPQEAALLVEATHGGRVSIARIRSIVTDLGDRAGVSINPHRLRDTFGTEMANSGADREHVRILMGHSRLEQTNAYVQQADAPIIASHHNVMGPRLGALLAPTSDLPAHIEKPPAGWPKLRSDPPPADEDWSWGGVTPEDEEEGWS